MATARSALPDGYVLGDYKIERILGAGGFGITYLAKDAALKRLFAIKEFCPYDLSTRDGMTVHPFADAREDYERGLNDFIKEAQTLARFHHRNIVGVARIFEANNTAYMVLNFEKGRSLKEWLRERDTRPDQNEIDAVAGPLLEALEVIHADGTLHRDIAPDNIYIRKDGSPVLLDFGSARQALTMRSRSVSAIIKAGYSPQEQYSTRAANQGPWTDIYALAATLYRMITGEAPPEASDRTIDDNLAPLAGERLEGYRPTFLAAVDWGLSLRPKDRPQTVAEWSGSLLRGEAVPRGAIAAPANPAPAAPRGSTRMRTAGLAAAVLLAVAGSVGATAFYFRDRIAMLTASAETQIAQLRSEVEKAMLQSDATRRELDEARSASASELARLQVEIEMSRARSSSLTDELQRAEQKAEEASAAEKKRYLDDVAELQRRIEQERERASSLEEAEKANRDTLSVEIVALERRLAAELAARGKMAEEAELLRRQAFASSIEFAGLELGPANPDSTHNIRGVKLDSWFRGRVREAEVVARVAVNGAAVDLADADALRRSEANLSACDVLVAELGPAQSGRRVEATIPSSYGFRETGADAEIPGLGMRVREGAAGRPRISLLAPDSAFRDAGLQDGDEILSLSNRPVASIEALVAASERVVDEAGKHDVDYLRDCEKRTAAVDFGDPDVELEWMGLTLGGKPGASVTVRSIGAGTGFAGLDLAAGDAIRQISTQGRTVALATMADALETLPDIQLCGAVSLDYRRSGPTMDLSARITNFKAQRTERVSLTELGIEGWLLADGRSVEVTSVDPTRNSGWNLDLRPDDILLRLGMAEGHAIGAMDSLQQRALMQNGGPLEARRNCAARNSTIAPYDPESRPVDLSGISNAERSAILKALYAMGHYRSSTSSESFVTVAVIDPDVRRAISGFKQSRGERANAELTQRDLNYLVPLGRVNLPGDQEKEVLRQILPADVANDTGLINKRIDLFLRANGYSGDRRVQLGRFLASRGETSSEGFVTSLPLAREIFSSTLRLDVNSSSTLRTFGDWIYNFNSSQNRCEIFSMPTEVEGFLFDFSFGTSANNYPNLYMGVDRNQRNNALYLNFSGGSFFSQNDTPHAVADNGTRYSMRRMDGTALFPRASGTGSDDELHKALRRGQWMEIVGISRYGGTLRIRYSARGFTDAFMHMRSECNVRQLTDWFN